ncbi:unnamed protein product [Mytilus coruscus]|uniref:Uncharacterized protein n=1 Tax=Mytilus coruscus TaxID=42192 RepID=A0A6J8BZ39_MYTCO|nr:unnamed protein product [Mytilus coruscus]
MSVKSQSTQRRHQKLFFNKFIDSKIKESPYLQPQFISSLDKELYKGENLNQPLYRESKTTLLDSLFRHFVNFSSNNGSYKDAYKLLKPLLIKTTTYDACVNDCQLFRKTNASDYSMDVECGKCGEARYSDHSPSARKTYTYMPLGPRLVRIYGDDNICKLMFSRPDLSNGKLSDIADGNLYKSWFQRGGVFEDTEERCTVPLALFCDGLNPHKSMATQKSMWPLMLTCLIYLFQ